MSETRKTEVVERSKMKLSFSLDICTLIHIIAIVMQKFWPHIMTLFTLRREGN